MRDQIQPFQELHDIQTVVHAIDQSGRDIEIEPIELEFG
jgi:hypothetical protein